MQVNGNRARWAFWLLVNLIVLVALSTQCSRYTFAQECGIDYLNQNIRDYKQVNPRTDSVLTIPVVVHVVHKSFENYGVGSNITDEQILSAISSFNTAMATNVHGDVGVRLCMAVTDPDGNETNGITRSTNNTTYDVFGVQAATGTGISDYSLKSGVYWNKSKYYNIYVVGEIDGNNAGNGVQGYAYYPTASMLDGTVVLYNVIGTVGNLKPTHNLNKTFIHEILHGLNLIHTHENTNGCAEINCLLQGDRLCDTPPHPVTWSCSQNCPDAPTQNYMSYSPQECRTEVTPDGIARVWAAMFSTHRMSLLTSDACSPPQPPPPTNGCPNNWCEDAIAITCDPIEFDNYSCTNNYECILQHPVAQTGTCCGGTWQGNTQWFKFTAEQDGWYAMEINGNFTTGQVLSGNYGAFEGVKWYLAEGDCDNLNWIAADMCPQANMCFCGPLGPGAWAGDCEDAPCTNPQPVELMPYWYNQGLFPSGTWQPYDPTQQYHLMYFPLTAGTYHLMIGGFIASNGQQTFPSLGTATASMCFMQPLPIELLEFSGYNKDGYDHLKWVTATETNNDYFRLLRSSDGKDWQELGTVQAVGNSSVETVYERRYEQLIGQHETTYYVLQQIDFNGDFEQFQPIAIDQTRIINRSLFDILGRQGVKVGVR